MDGAPNNAVYKQPAAADPVGGAVHFLTFGGRGPLGVYKLIDEEEIERRMASITA